MHVKSGCDRTAPAAACLQVAAFEVTSWFHLLLNLVLLSSIQEELQVRQPEKN